MLEQERLAEMRERREWMVLVSTVGLSAVADRHHHPTVKCWQPHPVLHRSTHWLLVLEQLPARLFDLLEQVRLVWVLEQVVCWLWLRRL